MADVDSADLPRGAAAFARYEQTYPTLTPHEIDRMRRFGEVHHYSHGEVLFETGKPGPGMFVVLSGTVVISHRDGMGHVAHIIDQGPGQFMAEIGQLSGRVALVDGHADGDGEDDEGGVAGVADDGAETDNGEGSDEAEGAGDVVADDLGDHGDQDREENEGGGEGGFVRNAGGFGVNPGDGGTCNEGRAETEEDGGWLVVRHGWGVALLHVTADFDWRIWFGLKLYVVLTELAEVSRRPEARVTGGRFRGGRSRG